MYAVAILLVAGAGGHLDELWQLRSRIAGLEGDVTWVTCDTPQARSLLAAEQRLFAPPTPPHDVRGTMANLRFARHVLALADWTDVVTTGPLLSVPFLILARRRGVRAHYIESPTRVSGPSLSASILERVPGVHLYSPYRWWRRKHWVFRGSVLDGFAPAPAGPPQLRRVVVTLGTSCYGFPRLVRAVRRALPDGCQVFWQTGHTLVDDSQVDARAFVPAHELSDAMAAADLVISHAGVGSALSAMRVGRAPLLVPRRAGRGEHVDDHQVDIARELERRGLALACDADELEEAILWKAASASVRPPRRPPAFELEVA
jgi:UDP-N-acetylglucosamine--N-acetylmuramyl-(pentapeptide) pyrophosphoryl-undecaprenol N-acetylglucosamine transferase